MNFAEMCGQTLDDKYRIERELGRGGMGTVYLAAHVGTERHVAVKVIAPEFMERPEFVERFRREARAAGRLRHPNVVNVTDFGFSDTRGGRAAYLVMEYLDGCTLGEVLEEEKNLPLNWTLDILEQVCSAVHEAHEQGIIHRDLKPDNIWLEPNQRGGYTVKVLDFGIAKLEDQADDHSHHSFSPAAFGLPTFAHEHRATVADVTNSRTIGDAGTESEPAKTGVAAHLPTNVSETRTAILPLVSADPDTVGTRIIETGDDKEPRRSVENGRPTESTAADLTRVGSVLGTPLYMSPEQCRGEQLDSRSDVYSLGVIAYQMLSGSTPFSGDFTQVMNAHRELEPPPLNAKNVRRKLKRVISSAMAKNPDDRPQTAEAFASILRSRSEGIFGLLRRALMIYSEHLPKFVGISALLYIPFILASLANVATSFMISGGYEFAGSIFWRIFLAALTAVTVFFCTNLITGTNTWLVNQILSYPLRPVSVLPALQATRKNWKALIGIAILSTGMTFVGYLLLILPGLYMSVTLALVAPVVMMENLRGMAALRRSRLLVMRSLRTTAAAVAILFFVPVMLGGVIGFVSAASVKALSVDRGDSTKNNGQTAADKIESDSSDQSRYDEQPDGLTITVSDGRPVRTTFADVSERDAGRRIRSAITESLSALIWLPFQILIISFSSIIVALLYLKTRQAGGESLQDLLAHFEETGPPKTKWQEKVRQRLIHSGRTFSR